MKGDTAAVMCVHQEPQYRRCHMGVDSLFTRFDAEQTQCRAHQLWWVGGCCTGMVLGSAMFGGLSSAAQRLWFQVLDRGVEAPCLIAVAGAVDEN